MPTLDYNDFHSYEEIFAAFPKTPQEEIDYSGPTLQEIYDSGFVGAACDDHLKGVLKRQNMTFYQAFPESKDHGKGRLSLPYRAALIVNPDYASIAQTVGDCTSWGTKHSGEIDYYIDILFGETEDQGEFANEPIYGDRNHSSEGSTCQQAANYVSQKGKGGFLTRKKYTNPNDSRDVIDLSVYSGQRGSKWGRSGTPSWLSNIASENKALRVFICESVEEMRDAISLGFSVNVCSSYGFKNTRDKYGLCERSGTWMHSMSQIGFDDTEATHKRLDGPSSLVQNSWGRTWNSGPRVHDQPEGSFWIRPEVIKGMIKDMRDCYVIASVRGFNRELIYDSAGSVRQLSED